tara:strand:- start:833 stop:1204 length:372 start_codon:yes stop_codon:yes gene_type:complete
MKNYKVNDKVRAHDFEGNKEVGTTNACYVEGIVLDIVKVIEIGGCMCYELRCTKKVFGGEEIERGVGEKVFSPLNGTKTMFGKELNQVELVEELDKYDDENNAPENNPSEEEQYGLDTDSLHI